MGKIQSELRLSVPMPDRAGPESSPEPGSNVRVLRRRELGRGILVRDARICLPPQDSGMLLRPRLSITARPCGLGVDVAGTPLHPGTPRA